MKTAKLGKDDKNSLWEVEIESTPYVKGTHVIDFWAYPSRLKRRNHPPATAQVIVESDTVAKINYIGVDEPKRRLHVGSLLLDFVEQYMVHEGIKMIYGDISKDPSLYSTQFASLGAYLAAQKEFYCEHGWSWQLFGDQKPENVTNPYAIGRIEKRIG